MKLNKIFAVALAVLAMTSCDNDKAEDYPAFLGAVNTASGVTVSMPSTFSFNENEIPSYIPVTVSGEANGKVVVTVQVKELTTTPADTEPAKEGEHFNITSYTINIPAGETEGFIEVTPVWVTGEINDDRVFELTIVKAEGATVSNSTCEVKIVNIDDPYTSMCGTWTMTATNMSTGEPVSFRISMMTVDPSDEEYGTTLYGFGFAGDTEYLIPFTNFTYDELKGEGTVEIAYGYMMTDGIAFNYGLPGGAAFPVCLYRSSNGLTMSHEAVCTFDSEYNELVFPSDANVAMGLFYASDSSYSGYLAGSFTNFKMTR